MAPRGMLGRGTPAASIRATVSLYLSTACNDVTRTRPSPCGNELPDADPALGKRPAHSGAKQLVVDDTGQVNECAGGRGDRNALMAHDIPRSEHRGVMDPDPRTSTYAPSRNCDFRVATIPLDELPVRCGGEVAKGSVQADRLGCRQPCAFRLNRRVPHRKDRAVKRVEPPVPNASRDLLGRKPAVDEFAQGKDSPLVAGAPRDDFIGPRLRFVPATGGKYSLDVGSGVVPGLVLVAGVAHALVHCWSLPSLL